MLWDVLRRGENVNKKIKCDIYTRVSTTIQVDGYSLDAQKEKLKRYAEFQRMLDNIANGTDKVQFVPVSYTHRDVYKRQDISRKTFKIASACIFM